MIEQKSMQAIASAGHMLCFFFYLRIVPPRREENEYNRKEGYYGKQTERLMQ